MKIGPKLGYSAAILTVLVSILVPLGLMGFFSNRVGALGLHVDEYYVGGPVVRTIAANGYQIQIHKEFHPRLLQRAEPYVQLAWTPVKALGARVSDDVDIDGDGKPDVHVTFAVPGSARVGTKVDVDPVNPKFVSMHGVGEDSFSRFVGQVGDKIVVRIPLKK